MYEIYGNLIQVAVSGSFVQTYVDVGAILGRLEPLRLPERSAHSFYIRIRGYTLCNKGAWGRPP